MIQQQEEVSAQSEQKPPPRGKPHKAVPVEQHKPSGRPKGGVAAAAREMGVPRSTVQRALQPEPSLTMDDIMGEPAYASAPARRKVLGAEPWNNIPRGRMKYVLRQTMDFMFLTICPMATCP